MAFVPSLATPRPSARVTNSPFFILLMTDFVGSFGIVLTGCALASHARSSNFSSGSGSALSPSYIAAPPLHSVSKWPSHSSKSLTITFSLGTKTCTISVGGSSKTGSGSTGLGVGSGAGVVTSEAIKFEASATPVGDGPGDCTGGIAEESPPICGLIGGISCGLDGGIGLGPPGIRPVCIGGIPGGPAAGIEPGAIGGIGPGAIGGIEPGPIGGIAPGGIGGIPGGPAAGIGPEPIGGA